MTLYSYEIIESEIYTVLISSFISASDAHVREHLSERSCPILMMRHFLSTYSDCTKDNLEVFIGEVVTEPFLTFENRPMIGGAQMIVDIYTQLGLDYRKCVHFVDLP